MQSFKTGRSDRRKQPDWSELKGWLVLYQTLLAAAWSERYAAQATYKAAVWCCLSTFNIKLSQGL